MHTEEGGTRTTQEPRTWGRHQEGPEKETEGGRQQWGGPRVQMSWSPGQTPFPAGSQVSQSYGKSGEIRSGDGRLNQGPVITVRAAPVGCGFESLEVSMGKDW